MTQLIINGESLSTKEAADLVEMLYQDAKQVAGEFHGLNRSVKFRVNWPNEYDFADSEWRNFVVATRAMYADRLANPRTPPEDARKISLALIVERMVADGQKQAGVEGDNRLQLSPNTLQFEGDKRENTLISERFGHAPNLRAKLRAGVAKLARMH